LQLCEAVDADLDAHPAIETNSLDGLRIRLVTSVGV
jgi:hypothetical protein